ncbi:hypothetical protein NL351_26715, partial [Klebsiella pneumoniae]|nr:hypothetical protein [Klebsiella pneumoniae]
MDAVAAIAEVKGWNACRAAMLQENAKSAGESNNCRSNEKVQAVQGESRCSTKAAPTLDSSPKTTESRCSNSPVIPDGWKMVPIDATRAMIDAARRVEEDGYDAMHKAMLAAAPHDTPALNSLQSVDSVTGGWIPVSERMP